MKIGDGDVAMVSASGPTGRGRNGDTEHISVSFASPWAPVMGVMRAM